MDRAALAQLKNLRRDPFERVGAPRAREVLDLHQDASIDLVIRYSLDDYPNFYGLCLFDECFAVYGSPAQVALAGERRPTLISVRWHNSRLYAHGWEAWCAQAGENWMEGQPVIRQYDEEHYALQAAIAGQGLVLASSILVSESVASGLLQPYRADISVDGAGYNALGVQAKLSRTPGAARRAPPLFGQDTRDVLGQEI